MTKVIGPLCTLLLLGDLLGCEHEHSIEINTQTPAGGATTPSTLQAVDSMHTRVDCHSCAGLCRGEELRCLSDFSPENICTDGLGCVQQAVLCVERNCGAQCSDWILLCDFGREARAVDSPPRVDQRRF